MTNRPIIPAEVPGAPAGVITHTYLRLRGTQHADDITVYHAQTKIARVTLSWGGVLMGFLNAEAAQGVLEGFSAARTTIVHLPAEVPAIQQEPYDRPTIAIDWTGRPGYAVMPKNALTPDNRRTIRWTEVYMGPLTFQILDRAAFHSTLEVLRQIHHTAVAVCPDGKRFRADPTLDDHRPPQ